MWTWSDNAMCTAIMNIIAISLLRTRNHIIRPPMHPFDTHLLRRTPVLLLLGWGFFSMLGYMVLLYSLSDFGRAIGLRANQAASVTALLNLGTMLGRPCIGLLSDRYGRIEVAGWTTLACSVCVWAFWVPATSYALLVVFAIAVGGILGIFWMVRLPFADLALMRSFCSRMLIESFVLVYKPPVCRGCWVVRTSFYARARLRYYHSAHYLC